jgi:small GTP-binding protein
MCPVQIADKPSLLTRYENLRRREFEQLTALLDTLGKVDGLPEAHLEQARDALFHADHPYLIVLVGPFNTGKSSLINALIGEPVLSVGATPTTTRIAILRHGPAAHQLGAGAVDTVFHPSPLLERVSLVDTPGLDSVFKGHDEVTRRFLHRADIVWLVMLATQAMSASNVAYLQALRAYGKRVIVVVNQIDLLEPEERPQIRDFVAEQGRVALGRAPDVWMISARWAGVAGQMNPRDEARWTESGFAQIEAFINTVLSDAERVRQKLETPLQIARNVMSVASTCLREQQDALAQYRRAADNVRAQIEAAIREQEATVRATLEEIDRVFAESIRRGREAIHEVFVWSKALSLAFGGLLETFGLARFFRRFGGQTPARHAFTLHRVDEPLATIPEIAERLGPRLEGRDVKDADDLIAYTRRAIEQLPSALHGKIIGTLAPPATYDRSALKLVRDRLAETLEGARTTEFRTIDRAVRNTIVTLGVYLMSVLIIGLALFIMFTAAGAEGSAWALLMVAIIALFFGGLAVIPLRGAVMENAHAARVRAVRTAYLDILAKAASDQVAYGRQMRQDAVAPFMRMVEAQVAHADGIKAELAAHEQHLTALEAELGTLRG